MRARGSRGTGGEPVPPVRAGRGRGPTLLAVTSIRFFEVLIHIPPREEPVQEGRAPTNHQVVGDIDDAVRVAGQLDERILGGLVRHMAAVIGSSLVQLLSLVIAWLLP